MKLLSRSKLSRTAVRWLLLALLLLASLPVRADLEERWLLVFDTSWAMKKRLPAMETAVKEMLATSIAGQLHEGDTVGVWTFDQQLRLGEFPLITWQPGTAAVTTSNLVAFLHRHRYKDETNLMVLQPVLDRVIDDSERLTIVIFCDGYGEINWTPYDRSINETIRQNQSKQKEARQPFVLLLRTQFGKFVGFTVNFPPNGITLPPFPPPPNAAKPLFANPPPVEPVAPAAPKPLPLPALVIVGTTVGTNPVSLPPPAPVTNAASATNVAPPSGGTNSAVATVPHPPGGTTVHPTIEKTTAKKVSPPAVAAPAGNAPAIILPVTNLPATNAPAEATKAHNGFFGWLLPALGVLAAAGLVIFFVTRSRRPHSSLITDSMNLPPDPPRQP
jgi:hypothetical protein